MQPAHVPAWKRLGLKLKYAKESDDKASAVAPVNKKGADDHVLVVGTVNESPVLSKRRRTESSVASPTLNGDDSRVLSPSLKRQNLGGLKKRVSFTAETKQLDGDSSKSLIAAWEAENLLQEQLLYANPVAETKLPKLESNPEQVVKKGQQKKQNETKIKPRKSTDALDYLKQFHQNRQNWKFNKNREVWILQHILSLDDIPASYDTALAQYVQGLKSKTAKSRLADECSKATAEKIGGDPQGDEIVDKAYSSNLQTAQAEGNGVEDPSRQKACHTEAKERFKKNIAVDLDGQEAKADEVELSEYQRRFQLIRRARLVLQNMPPVEEVSDGTKVGNGNIHPDRATFENGGSVSQEKEPTKNEMGKGRQRTRKRKIRTNISIDASDSSSGDSSDSSNEEARGRKSPGLTSSNTSLLPISDDSTSTSGSDITSDGDTASPSDSDDNSDEEISPTTS